jgi:tetratricopeptide (TPR) repeat protein
MSQGPSQTDYGARATVAATAVVVFGVLYIWAPGLGLRTDFLGMVIIAGISVAIGWVMQITILRLAAGLIDNIHAAGSIPRPPDFSAQDTLIVRGRYAEAAESFQKHLLGYPEDNEARIRLAQLYERELADPRQAEEWYLAARRREPTRQQEALIANSLIDLFRRTGQRGRLMAELSKFAERYKGTGAGDAAGRELGELKAKP